MSGSRFFQIVDKAVAAAFTESKAPADEKLVALMLKVRKKAWSSVTMPKLFEILSRLSGYKIRPVMAWMLPTYDKETGLTQEGYPGRDFTEEKHREWKAREVTTLPPIKAIGQKAAMNVGPVLQGSGNYHYFKLKVWEVVPGLEIAYDPGKKGGIAAKRVFLPHWNEIAKWTSTNFKLSILSHLVLSDIFRFLFADTPFERDLNAYLATPLHEKAAPRTRENTGTCAICWGNYKLEGGLVLHGYKRPGTGETLGRCPGVRHEPLELSPERASWYLEQLMADERAAKSRLTRLKNGEADRLVYGQTRDGKPNWISSDHPAWKRTLENAIRETENEIVWLGKMVDLYRRLVAKWRVRPMPKEGEFLRLPEFFLK